MVTANFLPWLYVFNLIVFSTRAWIYDDPCIADSETGLINRTPDKCDGIVRLVEISTAGGEYSIYLLELIRHEFQFRQELLFKTHMFLEYGRFSHAEYNRPNTVFLNITKHRPGVPTLYHALEFKVRRCLKAIMAC